MKHNPLGKTGLEIPPIVFGSTILGNLFQVIPYDIKQEIIAEVFKHIPKPVVIDSAGKYGAGLALEVLGDCLRVLGITENEVVISNKLGWIRTPLTSSEPTFEKDVWFGLEHDAVQDISYDGILRCWEQGLELLGGDYTTQIVSVHDPDEYLDAASSDSDRQKRLEDIIGAYTALIELKNKGHVQAVGVGAKNWKVVHEIHEQVNLDWVMLANSYTIYSHPIDLLDFMDELHEKQIAMINAAVFNAGFLIGGDYFNYRKLDPYNSDDHKKFTWRERFFNLCEAHHVKATDVCIQFGNSHPAIVAIALSAHKPQHVRENINSLDIEIPPEFWTSMRDTRLISNHPYM